MSQFACSYDYTSLVVRRRGHHIVLYRPRRLPCRFAASFGLIGALTGVGLGFCLYGLLHGMLVLAKIASLGMFNALSLSCVLACSSVAAGAAVLIADAAQSTSAQSESLVLRYNMRERTLRVIKDGVCAQAVNPRVVGRWQWRSAGTGRAQQVFQIDVHEGEQLLCTITAYLACGELRRFASAINEHTQ